MKISFILIYFSIKDYFFTVDIKRLVSSVKSDGTIPFKVPFYLDLALEIVLTVVKYCYLLLKRNFMPFQEINQLLRFPTPIPMGGKRDCSTQGL